MGILNRRLGLYSYRYLWDSTPRIGLMAQEVEKLLPQAVCEIDGLKRVNYPKALSWAFGDGCVDLRNGRLLDGGSVGG